MRKRYLALALILCLALAGCRQKTAQVTPEPSPKVETAPPSPSAATPSPVTPTPPEGLEPTAAVEDWKNDPKGYFFDCLDWLLEEDELVLRFWQHPGSGPSLVELSKAEYGETIRALFEELGWDNAQLLEREEMGDCFVDAPATYTVTLHHLERGDIYCNLNNDIVWGDRGENTFYFRVDGAENLCEKLTDIVPSVYINLGRARVPPQESKEATLKLYVETALEQMKENGHITDYILRVCEPFVFENDKKEEPAWETHPGIPYTIAYSVKPAHPELSFWRDLDEDGWQNVDWRDMEFEYWERITYDERDGCYGMS